MTSPRPVTAGLPDARQDAVWQRLRRRLFTSAGTLVKQSVTNGATSVTVTWPRTEPDTDYGIVATPSWATTVYVSGRTTTGATLTFGSAAGANATVDIITFRQA